MKKRLYKLRDDIIAFFTPPFTRDDIVAFFTSPFTHLRFIYQTEIYPRKAEHHWCKFYDWVDKTEKEGWYVFDKHGRMIPWVHFDNGSLICLYQNSIDPIEK